MRSLEFSATSEYWQFVHNCLFFPTLTTREVGSLDRLSIGPTFVEVELHFQKSDDL